jgi:hypothetical protein
MSDEIKRALREAQMHAVGYDGEPIPAGPIIAAFLRALPAYASVTGDHISYWPDCLAAAVEAAARSEEGKADG